MPENISQRNEKNSFHLRPQLYDIDIFLAVPDWNASCLYANTLKKLH